MRTDRPTDGQTDMRKLIVTFHNFVKAPKGSLMVISITLSPLKLRHNLRAKYDMF